MEFSTFIPLYGNKNPNIRYFVHLENGKKKELKHDHDNIYYFCRDRKRTFVEVNGSLYHKQFKIIAQGETEMKFREQLNKVRELNISICDLEIANECDCIFEFACTEEEFEQLCEFAKTVYLKAEEMTANAVAKMINELIVYSGGYSIEQVLSMDIWKAIEKASYYL